MKFKYSDDDLNKEIENLNKIKEIKILKIDKINNELILSITSEELNYNIIFSLDISNSNNNLFKNQYEIKKSENIDDEILNKIIYNYYNSFQFFNSQNLSSFFTGLIEKIKTDTEIKENINLNKKKNIYFIFNKSESSIDNESKIRKSFFNNIILINIFSILLKTLTGLYEYNGENKPPKYGNFETQRHWMEITINLKITDWYNDSVSNPKDYWPIDYPPLSAYHSYIFGYFFKYLIPDSMALFKSHGYENNIFKILMRLVCLFSDVFIFHFACFLFCKFMFVDKKINGNENYFKFYIMLFILLVSPIFIIIDHGHFQFNQVMHGLFIFSIYFLYKGNFFFGILFYTLCINFKQMGLYYSIPIFLYIIKYTLNSVNRNIFKFVFYIILYTFYVLFDFILIWSPWIYNLNIEHVIKRIFRKWDIKERKVANFWYLLNYFYELSNSENLVKYSIIIICITIIIPCFKIIFSSKVSIKQTNFAFFIISLSFYLFSYNVSEKSIMIPFLGYLLCFFYLSEILPSFYLVSMFSLQNLLEEDNLLFPYFIFIFMFYCITKFIQDIFKINELVKKKKIDKINVAFFFNLLELFIIIFIIGYNICKIFILSSSNSIINCIFSFCYFLFIFIYSNIEIFKI